MTLARDLSNYTQPFGLAKLQEWKDAGVGLCIIQAVSPPPGYPSGRTRVHLQACATAGMPTDAYLYLWTGSDVEADMRAKLALLDGFEDQVGRLWLDCEDTTAASPQARQGTIRWALAVLDEWSSAHGKPIPGIYTGRWWWTAYVDDTTEFADRPLWASQYDGIADASVVDLFGGWQSCAIKQYAGSQPDGTDLNVLAEEVPTEVKIPHDYVTKFHLANDQDINGLIDNFEGVITTVRNQALAEGAAAGADAQARLDQIKAVLAA